MHPCPVCPKSFPSPSKLQRHYVIHTGQKPFICTICGTSLTQSGHLKTHLQKVHHLRLPADGLRDGTVTRNQRANNRKPAAGINARGRSMPSTLSSSVAYQLEWKREHVAHKTVNPPKHVSHESDVSVTRGSVSNVKDPISQEQSVCNAHNGYTSFTSSPPLWIQPPTHDKPKHYESSRESGQTFPQRAYSKRDQQSQGLRTSGRKMTFKHQCPICLKTFCSPSKLQRHSLMHTGQKPYSCMICRKAFRQKVHLKSHLSSPNKCSLSDRAEREKQRFGKSRQTSGLQLQSSFQQRPSSHRSHGNSSVELELQCNIRVNAVQDLVETEIKSEAAVTPEHSFNTSSQGRSICHKSDEQEQRYFTQKPLKPSQCMISNRSMKLEGDLAGHHEMYRNLNESGTPTTVQNRNHLNISDSEEIRHLPEPSLADPVDPNIIVKPEPWSVNCSDFDDPLPQDCAVVSSPEQQRKTCQATREQQNIHLCHACLKCFPSVSKLQRHVMTHTGQRPFGCEICGKRFRQKTHLRVHCRTHLWSRYHRQRSLYINRPPSCSGGFNRRTAADGPVQETVPNNSLKHLDQTPCVVIIPNPDGESDKLSPHSSKKKEVVRKVSTATVKRTPIANVTQSPGKVQHKCCRCLKSFPSPSKLQRHEMVHMGLKLFPCVLCGKAFRQAAHLKTHERTHCERKPAKPVSQQENIRKLKADIQRQPWTSVRTPQQNTSVNKGSALSESDGAAGNEAMHATSISKGNNLLKTKFESSVTCKKRKLHTCQICFRNFAFPYKLSRHLATHSGTTPYKCTSCGKTFTQLGHLKVHERRCRQGNGVPHVQGETMTTDHLQEKCLDGLSGCTDVDADATREPVESHLGHSFTDRGSSYFSEAIHTGWLAGSEEGLQEENSELEKKLRDYCYQATCDYDKATDHAGYSFPSELSFEIDKLVQNQNMAAPLFSPCEGGGHHVEVPCHKGAPAVRDSTQLLSDGHVTPLVDHRMQTDDYWCEPLGGFECDMCSASLKSKNDLEQHVCSTDVQPKTSARKNRCDVCFKLFVSPSKLRRHYLIHTGLRPFRCDICGKTFTQSAHARTHRLTH